MRHIVKIGLAVVDGDAVLLVRKRGSDVYILPGGKPEFGENDLEALGREIKEELNCDLNSNSVFFLGVFSDKAAGMTDVRVTVKLYSGILLGHPEPHSEIEQLLWFRSSDAKSQNLAPSLTNSILPFLFSTKMTAKSSVFECRDQVL